NDDRSLLLERRIIMRTLCSFGCVALAAVAVSLGAHVKAQADDKAKASQLKKLAGDWTGKAKHGSDERDASVNYQVTSGGSAVVETLFPGTEHEMVTVDHQDGDDLVLTHYCMLHNQPRMRAERNGAANKLAFKFSGGTNVKPDKDPHMHDVTLEI